jgi:hypothetical protein
MTKYAGIGNFFMKFPNSSGDLCMARLTAKRKPIHATSEQTRVIVQKRFDLIHIYVHTICTNFSSA